MTNPLYDRMLAGLKDQDRTFLTLADGSTLSGAAFHALAARQAGALAEAGLEPGDRVAVQVAKSPEALAIYAACVMSGVVLLPLNTAYTAAELEYFINDAKAGAVICDPAAQAEVSRIVGANGAQVMTLDKTGQGSFRTAWEAQPDTFAPVARKADDLAALLYTSGTTGRSKGAMLSQTNLISNAETLVDLWRFGPDDVLLHMLPIFHTHGLFVATNVILAAGASMIFLPAFDTAEALRLLPQSTSMMGVPTFYTRLLGDPAFGRDHVANMRVFISGSAPLLAETHVAFEERTGHRILERYGMTETNMNTSNPYDGERRAGTVGFPLPDVELKITDPESSATLPQGEVGIIEVRGPNVFQGYWNMPEKTAEELRDDGFFITGDLGQMDPDGYIQIVGRQKDLIITGGLNVYPKEIEMVLDDMPGVLESAVIGVPHPDFGEAVVGVLVADGDGPDMEAVQTAAAAQLAKFKQPKALRLLPELPRNTMGKVQKQKLRADFADLFSGS
ncbi:malonyl-CoA synthase [Maritimibacter sp. UBA3975]|uniref:malonate--CoA ligase n=1 Tax=Maritimibacter sp. UBA3975 TaxID=1946833 RepID=UPI000C09CC5C|nr:malonyl-CoA synthase [Maritimibacter sp. UBA3975]MAM59917.1 malonyl-CoA synthase [Maritimibacter sp.]|tara:strand:- start:12830 stop:14344 length:1515 start_codon:yes stop_codon:yes gene_type:complete